MTEQSEPNKNLWEIAQVEYNAALEQYRHYMTVRRTDMAFVTTIQIAILTIIGADIQNLNLSSFLLSLMAFFVLLLGINSELRLATYMLGYKERVIEIEKENHLKSVSNASRKVKEMEKKMFNLTNRKIFPLYYLIFAVIWFVIWIVNLL